MTHMSIWVIWSCLTSSNIYSPFQHPSIRAYYWENCKPLNLWCSFAKAGNEFMTHMSIWVIWSCLTSANIYSPFQHPSIRAYYWENCKPLNLWCSFAKAGNEFLLLSLSLSFCHSQSQSVILLEVKCQSDLLFASFCRAVLGSLWGTVAVAHN